MTSDLEPERLRARLVELLDPAERAEARAAHGTARQPDAAGQAGPRRASGPPRDRRHDRAARDDRPERRSHRQDPFGCS